MATIARLDRRAAALRKIEDLRWVHPAAQVRAADGKCPGIATQGLAECRRALIAL